MPELYVKGLELIVLNKQKKIEMGENYTHEGGSASPKFMLQVLV